MSGDLNIEVITGGPAPARRGLSRRWVVLIVVGALLLAAASVYGLDTRRRQLAADRAARAAQAAQTPAPLRKLGGPVPMVGERDLVTGLAISLLPAGVAIVGDRAVGVGESFHQHMWVSGMDLSTGDPAFAPVDLGQGQPIPGTGDPYAPFAGAMFAFSQGVVLLAQMTDGQTSSKVLMVIDPASGQPRWRTDLGAYWHPFADMLVVADPKGTTLRGLDWRTGSTRWQLPRPDGARYAVVSAGGGELPRSLSPPYAATVDRRLFETDPDGTLAVYDVSDGRQMDRRPATAPTLLKPADQLFEFVADETLYRIWPSFIDGYDLRRGQVAAVFTAPANRHIVETTVCGTGRLCIHVVQPAPCTDDPCVHFLGPLSDDPLFLDLVQTSNLGILWEQPDMPYGGVEASGDRILADGTELFDRDGHKLFVHQGTGAAWISPDRVLLVDYAGASPFSQNQNGGGVFEVAAATGKQTTVGAVHNLNGLCAVDTHTLVCPAIEGMYAWRL